MSKILQLILAIAIVLPEGLAAAQSPKRYDIGELGRLSLNFPDTWLDTMTRSPDSNGTTIKFTPKSGSPFEVIVSAGMVIPASETRDPSEVARAIAGDAASGAVLQAVEPELAIVELKGDEATAHYFSATDKAPKPDEFKYLTQGAVVTGRVLMIFTILTNDDSHAADANAIDMIKTLTFEPSKKPGTENQPRRLRRLEPGET